MAIIENSIFLVILLSVNLINCETELKTDDMKTLDGHNDSSLLNNESTVLIYSTKGSIDSINILEIDKNFLVSINETFKNISDVFSEEISKVADILFESNITVLNNENKTNVLVKIFDFNNKSSENNVKIKENAKENGIFADMVQVLQDISMNISKTIKKVDATLQNETKINLTNKTITKVAEKIKPIAEYNYISEDLNKTTIENNTTTVPTAEPKNVHDNYSKTRDKINVDQSNTIKNNKHNIEAETKSIANESSTTNKSKTAKTAKSKNNKENDLSLRVLLENALKAQRNEIIPEYDGPYYDEKFDEEYNYPNIDYLDIYKDTTNEYVPYFNGVIDSTTTKIVAKNENKQVDSNDEFENSTYSTCHGESSDLKSAIYTWIATIFVKSSVSGQFDYVCDGALIKPNVVLTSARCIMNNTMSINKENILVILGKTSLQNSNSKEQVVKVTSTKFHDNFTQDANLAQDDLAMLLLEGAPKMKGELKTACLKGKQEVTEKYTFTTGWQVNGEPINIKLIEDSSIKACQIPVMSDNKVACYKYIKALTTCPSHGGLLFEISENNSIFIKGIRFSDTTLKHICVGNNLMFTQLNMFLDWLEN